MILPETFEVARLFRDAAVRYWIFGGNGVELVVGADIRPHDDVDVFVAAADAAAAVAVLEQHGFRRHAGSLEVGDVFYERQGVLIDVVPIHDGADPPRTLGKLADISLPSGLLSPFAAPHEHGEVITLTAAMHLAMKAAVGAFYGTGPREKDLQDEEHLRALVGPPRG